jgi:pyocin large subunit-like protein
MSMEALKWARESRAIGGPASAVLRDLADRASSAGVCWPSVATIATSTGYCERTVQNALRRLEREKLISSKRTGRGSRYTLAIADLRCISCTSEVQEMPIRGAGDAPKAKRSQKKPITLPPLATARAAAAAYKPFVDADDRDDYVSFEQLQSYAAALAGRSDTAG